MLGLSIKCSISNIFILLAVGLTFFTDSAPVYSDTSGVVPKKQFVLPPKNKTASARDQMRGRVLYHYYCATCHGATGNTDGFNSYSLTPPPPKLNDREFMRPLSDTIIKRAIKEGGGGLGLSPHMPSWDGVLTDQNIADLTNFIHTLVK
jgi:mono/diheme cytochrome c family protein